MNRPQTIKHPSRAARPRTPHSLRYIFSDYQILLQQQRVDTMRVDHLFTRRPGEDCEATVLRRHQGQRIALVVDELRRR